MQNLQQLYERIRETLANARLRAYAVVNFAMVESYWQIGQLIVEEEQNGKERADYGKYLLKELSKRLTADFGRGFDESNLRYIRSFYLTFPIRDALRHELTWTHYRLLTRVENERARTFYLTEAIEARLSTRQLERQINSFYYERMLSSRERLELRADENQTATKLQPADITKDPYVLEFLDLGPFPKLSEKELEQRQRTTFCLQIQTIPAHRGRTCPGIAAGVGGNTNREKHGIAGRLNSKKCEAVREVYVFRKNKCFCTLLGIF